ncbi:MAG: PaaI family thioesterase [Acidimicrobiales bacterium]
MRTFPIDLGSAVMELNAQAVNEMLAEFFPGAGASCAELGPDFAVASNPISDFSIRPGGFVSGPTQFAMADAALWYLTFVAIGRIEPMALTSELSIRFLRPAQGERIWARAQLNTATRRSVVGSVDIWMDDQQHRPTAVAQGTYVLPRT